MGREAVCKVETDTFCADCRVHLDSDSIVIRGGLKRVIPLRSLVEIQTEGDRLQLSTTDEAFSLQLGENDSRSWEKAIRNPPTLLTKLGVKDGFEILALGFSDRSFLGGHPSREEQRPGNSFDLVFLRADSMDELSDLESLVGLLRPKGAIWIVSPKGVKVIPEIDVIMRGRAAGMTDTKVCRFSDTLTARRFVRKSSA